MGAHAPGAKATARIRRPGAERILAARRQAKRRLVLEARHRFLALAIVLVAASVLSPAFAMLSPQRTFTVASGSMEPAIPRGSLVFVSDREPQVGDVIVYEAPVGGHQVHRVVALVDSFGLVQYVTQGDANPTTDSFIVQPDWVVGVVTRDVPFVGNLWLIPLSTQALAFFLGILLYVGICAWDARALMNGPRFRFTFTSLALVLLIPSGWAATGASYPASAHALEKAAAQTPLIDGDMGGTSIGADLNDAAATVVAPKLWKEIVMWPCDATVGCTISAPALAYATQAGSIVAVDAADYVPAPTFYFEAFMAAPTAQTISAILYDRTGAATVPASEVSTASTTATAVRSGGFSLSGDKEYQFQLRNSGVIAGGTFSQAKLIVSQDFPTATETQSRIAGASQTSSTSFVTPSRAFRWNHDASGYDGVSAAFFEVTAQVSAVALSTTGEFRLVDRTSATVVSTISTTSTSATRVRGSLTVSDLVQDHEYEVEFRADGGVLPTITLHGARIGILQSAFTKTVRYIDLAWQVTTTSTSFAAVAHTGNFQTTTEWGAPTGFFEASLVGSAALVTASAELFDNTAGAAIAASQRDVTGTTLTRSRSGALDLPGVDSGFQVRLKTSAGTSELRNAWLIVPQAVGKTYDAVLEARNDVLNACTWEAALHLVSSSGLTRLTAATISLRSDGGTESQIVVASGTVTQSSGTTVAVAFGDAAEVIVFTNPSSAGSSAIDAELRWTCVGYGIHMVQPLAFTLA